MRVYTDNPQFARGFLPRTVAEALVRAVEERPDLVPVLRGVFPEGRPLYESVDDGLPYHSLLLSEYSNGSHYDRLIELARSTEALPDRMLCLAGSGSGFHGFKGRSWATEPGNLHLVVHLSPERAIDRSGVAFTMLAALSVTDALAQIAGLEEEPRIKWVNDVLLSEAKVGGVLAYTQTRGEIVCSAILGIGVNLESRPKVPPTPFVPSVASVREFLARGTSGLRATFLRGLLRALDANYRLLLEMGSAPVFQRYRERSMVVGEEVIICSEDSNQDFEVVAEGRVTGLGDNLELILDGRSEPVTRGRLVLRKAVQEQGAFATGAETALSGPHGGEA